jgi:hypothetical protein
MCPTGGDPGLPEPEILLYAPPAELLVERTRREGGGTPGRAEGAADGKIRRRRTAAGGGGGEGR